MPKLRRLSGKEVISFLQKFGFEVYSQSGSHVKLERITEDRERQRIVVAVHGNKDIKSGTLRSIYRTALQFIPEDEIRPYFYADN
jgi:predicted RNA binding protein YcfA (HicA-like mRNA interferase family)